MIGDGKWHELEEWIDWAKNARPEEIDRLQRQIVAWWNRYLSLTQDLIAASESSTCGVAVIRREKPPVVI
jgi:hypothetical protein